MSDCLQSGIKVMWRFSVLSLAMVLVGHHVARGVEEGEAVSAAQGNDAAVAKAKHLLRWRFVEGEIIRGKRVYAWTTGAEADKKRTDISYDYHWKVEYIDGQGLATIAVHFDRIQFRHRGDQVDFEYDSLNSDDAANDHDDPEVQAIVGIVGRLLESEFTIKVTPLGKVEAFEAADPDLVFPLWQDATPAKWPTLPENLVSVGDVWPRDAKENSTRYRLAKIEQVVDRAVFHIVGDGEVSRFDAKAGKFIDGASKQYAGSEEQPVASFEDRRRLFPGVAWAEPSNTDLAQVSSELDVWQNFTKAMQFGSQFEEHLFSEQSLYEGILNRLFVEIMPDEVRSQASDDWGVGEWIAVARSYERDGDLAKSKWALHKALTVAKSLGASYSKATALSGVAECLARIGDHDGARQAAAAIEGSAGTTGLHVTAQGPVNISAGAMKGYAQLLVVAEQAAAGQFEASSKTAAAIEDKNAKAAAYWVLAMHQAEQGNVAAATESAAMAKEATPKVRRSLLLKGLQMLGAPKKSQLVLELTHEGPKPAQLNAFKTLALSSIASMHALAMDQEEAASSLQQIESREMRNAATIEVVAFLTRRGHQDLADHLLDTLKSDAFFHSAALYQQAKIEVEKGEIAKAIMSAEVIRVPTFRSKMQMEICSHLADTDDEQKLSDQVDLARQSIEAIENPMMRAEALWELAGIQIQTERQDAAVHTLQTAQNLISESIKDPIGKAIALADVAGRMHSAGATDEAEALFQTLLDDIKELDEFSQAAVALAMVEDQLKAGMVNSAEAHAQSITAASQRCLALTEVGRRYAEKLELNKSREIFEEAFTSALEVVDILGLDTPYSKGGAIRLTAQRQAQCDLDGLSAYLEATNSSKVKAYGYLGALEALAPEAAQRADDRGSKFPNGLLDELWSARLIADVVQL